MLRVLLGLSCLLWAACGDGGGATGPGPVPTASVAGVVRDADSGTPVSGAAVTIGSVNVTTQADGRFEIQNITTIGSAVILKVSASGYDVHSQAIILQKGANNHDVTLTRKTIYETATKLIYLPPGIAIYRGVIVDLPGFEGDSRPWIRGDLTYYVTRPNYGDVAEHRRRVLLFAEQQQFAVLGTATTQDDLDASEDDENLAALTTFAHESGHPELAFAPLLLYGHSAGGCVGYGFTRLHADRVIGFLTEKGRCHTLLGPLGAKSVPGYLLIGEDDIEERLVNITQLFESGRTEDAPWAVAILPGEDHMRSSRYDLLFGWFTTIVARRLPAAVTPGQPVQLLPVDATTGWLGNRSTGAVAGYACYSGDKLLASWLPSEPTARDWQAAVLGTPGIVTVCN